MIYIFKVSLLFLINIVYNKIIPYPLWVEGQGKCLKVRQTIPSYPALPFSKIHADNYYINPVPEGPSPIRGCSPL
jgi:hypothetical protein